MREQLLGFLGRDLIGCKFGRNVRAFAIALEERAVAADAHNRVRAGNRKLRDCTRVDFAPVLEQFHETRELTAAAIEVGECCESRLVTVRDVVERLFHSRGEAVINELLEVFLEQSHDRHRQPRGDERLPLLPHVIAVLDHRDNARVRGRATNTEFL